MALPKLTTPTYELEIPSTDEKIKYRPFLVKEEKILMMAMESKSSADITQAVKDIVNEFLSFIDGKKLIIHNAEFDIGHLNNELKLIGRDKLKNEIIDTLFLAREKFPGSSINLDALCKKYRIDNSKREKHTALIDCDLLSKVYINLIDQKEPKLNFRNDSSDNAQALKTNISYFKKVIVPSEEEKRNHEQYLKINLKKNFFN